jgi:hypothetical protein
MRYNNVVATSQHGPRPDFAVFAIINPFAASLYFVDFLGDYFESDSNVHD